MSNANQFPAGTWQLDANQSSVTITVKKLGFMTVPGTLAINSGTIQVDNSGAITSVDVALDAASYDSSNPKRDEHVHSDDFLATDTYSTISFHSTKVTPSGSGFSAAGTVTIKGQPSPVTLAVTDVKFDDSQASFAASAVVDRRAIGVDKMPNFVIGQNLQLAIKAVAKNAG